LNTGAEVTPSINRILVVRLSAMGDIIHTIPAVTALREAFPQAMIGWLIEERWAESLCALGTPRCGRRSLHRPLVDWVHTVNLRDWKKSLLRLSTVQRIARVWNDIRSVRYELAIDLQGAMRSSLLANWSGAPVRWGAAEPRETPASLWYTRRVVTRGAHIIEQNVSLAEAVAQRKFRSPEIQLPHDESAEQRVNALLRQAGVGDFAILNPGAGWGAKCWPAERYGAVAAYLGNAGVRSVINYGPGEEQLAKQVESASSGAASALKFSIGELIALTRRARLFIGGDTGPLHLAAALHIPVVAIFGPTNPARNGPYGTRSVVLRNPSSPTTHTRRAHPDEGLLEISVAEVAGAAQSLLGRMEAPHA
jgi:heptosyltransferase-1